MILRTRLADLLIVTWAIPPARLTPLLPQGVTPALVNDRAFISAVWFRQEGMRLLALPWPRFSFQELNLRAYIECEKQHGVFFFQTQADTPLVLAANAIGFGWKRATIEVSVADGCYSAASTCREGNSECLVRIGEGLTEPIAPFADAEAMRRFLTHPLRGVVRSARGQTRYFSVDHPPFEPVAAEVADATCEPFVRWGLLDENEQRAPHSALYQAESEFLIHLPSRPLNVDR